MHKRASPHPQWCASSVPVRRRKEAEAGELAIGPDDKFELGSTRADSSLLIMSGSEIQGLRASTGGSPEEDGEGGMFAKRGRLQAAFVIRHCICDDLQQEQRETEEQQEDQRLQALYHCS